MVVHNCALPPFEHYTKIMEAEFYSQNPKFYVAVDCIILAFEDNKLKVLLQKRDYDPFKGDLSLMGGFVQEGENVKDAAYRVLAERTGITKKVFINQVGAFGRVDRDPGARVISVAYYALVDKSLCDENLNKKYFGFWANLENMPKLNFGHGDMVTKAIHLLRERIGKSPVGFHLLPELFTLNQLQCLYEAILGEELDKRNFRKKVAEMKFIEKTEKMDKIHSRRGAVLYQFNKEEYDNINKFKL